ncbi:MAG: type II CAAX endopeptidase family protein [Psychroserpens sp.]|uniref:CPBP family intramembrane glutamic endopeptidase n=1 Tax=Psychroserpens sp. TaxID=2020870 RepID=UPI0030033619
MIKKTVLFFFIAYFISWSLYFLYGSSEGTFIGYLIKFGFTISGIIMLVLTKDRVSFRRILSYFYSVKSLKFLWIGLLPLVAYLLSALLSVPTESLSLNHDNSLQEWIYTIGFSSSSGILFYMFFRGGLGEEIGLRGYLLPLLLQHIKPLKAALIIGVFWALWHYPIWISQGFVIVAVLTLAVLAWSVIFTYVFLKTKSLWVVIFLHATSNSGDEIIEFIFPHLAGFDWELYYVLFIIITGVILCFFVNKLELETLDISLKNPKPTD